MSISIESTGKRSTDDLLVPTKIIPELSKTNDALECYTRQHFSSAMQAYLVNYVLNISSNYSVYK